MAVYTGQLPPIPSTIFRRLAAFGGQAAENRGLGMAAGVDGQRENSLGQAEGIFKKHVGKPESGHCAGRLRVPTVNFETLEKHELETVPTFILSEQLSDGVPGRQH
ncbi:MAG TPA: hypothetical protein VF278_21370, partial [Pirellulales bacterium]